LDVARRQCRQAERRVGDPLPRRFRALLWRKLIAMERTRYRRSRLRRLEQPAGALVAEEAAAGSRSLLIVVVSALVTATKPAEEGGLRGTAGGQEQWRQGQSYAYCPRPCQTQRCSHLPLPSCAASRPEGALPLLLSQRASSVLPCVCWQVARKIQ